MIHTVKARGIDYDIDYETVSGFIRATHPELDDESDEFEAAVAAMQVKIEDDLPHTLTLEIECRKNEVEEMIGNAISDRTGWLINGVDSFTVISSRRK